MTAHAESPTRQLDLHGRTIVVTGASSGIGAVTARDLHERGATVIALGRDPKRTAAIAAELGTEPVIADFAVFADVRRAAAEILERTDRIDTLVNNAGALVPKRTVTVDGHELTFQANHLATFLLTHLLRPRLAQTAALGEGPVRVITTASLANRFGHVRRDDLDWKQRRWSPFRCYAQSKLLNILFARELGVRALADGVESYAFHPGNVATGFANTSRTIGLMYRVPLLKRFMPIDADAGAAPMTRLVVDSSLPTETGGYYDRFDPEQGLGREANDAELASWLWEESVRLTHLPSKLTTH
ncbi:MAG: SDR family NAD(P)-dependent oxidoreductase [Thermoleophilia bacterium]|nr:SDR family NAD(P)-dependent oxidoreductase [Thermoleophilia bacterium]